MGRTERAAVGLAAGLLLLSACGANTPPAPLHSVTLVTKSTQTEFWLSVFAGAEAAAAEYNLELTTVGPETEEDYETQNEMIARAVEAGTEALVFSAIDFEKNAPAVDAAAQAGVRIVSIDSGVDSSQVSTYIGTDNYAAGQMAAQAALEQVEGPLSVGLVNYDEGTANGQERERGRAGRPGPVRPGQRGRRDHHPGGRGQARRTPPPCWPGTRTSTSWWPSTSPPALGPPRRWRSWGWRSRCSWWGLTPMWPPSRASRPGAWTPSWFRSPYAMGYWGWRAPTGSSPGRRRSWPPWWTPPPRSFIGATCFLWTAKRRSSPSDSPIVGHYARYFVQFFDKSYKLNENLPVVPCFFPLFFG